LYAELVRSAHDIIRDMRDLLQQIENGLRVNLYYLSFISALSIPDMCAALSSPDGQATGARYADWFDQNVASRYRGNLDGQTCYQLRCSLLHEGTTQHPRSQYSRIIFLEPSSNFIHNNILNDALNLDLCAFCRDITASASNWLTTNENTPNFRTNFPKFIQRYRNGLSPYIVGLPVIG